MSLFRIGSVSNTLRLFQRLNVEKPQRTQMGRHRTGCQLPFYEEVSLVLPNVLWPQTIGRALEMSSKSFHLANVIPCGSQTSCCCSSEHGRPIRNLSRRDGTSACSPRLSSKLDNHIRFCKPPSMKKERATNQAWVHRRAKGDLSSLLTNDFRFSYVRPERAERCLTRTWQRSLAWEVNAPWARYWARSVRNTPPLYPQEWTTRHRNILEGLRKTDRDRERLVLAIAARQPKLTRDSLRTFVLREEEV